GIEMDFPLEIASPCEPPPTLLTGLGAEPVWIGRNRLDYVVEVASEDVLRSLKPDLHALAPIDTRGIVVTARAAAPQLSRYDYVLRFFGPRVGIPEDMVTGTAHCALVPYWRDKFADGRTMFTAFQASPRGGFVSVRLEGDRVMIGGNAVTVLRGQLLARKLFLHARIVTELIFGGRGAKTSAPVYQDATRFSYFGSAEAPICTVKCKW